MAQYFLVFAAVCVAVGAAPPASPRLYQQHATGQIQQINPLDYYLDNSEVSNYYSQAQQKPAGVSGLNDQSARLETLEPDSEVELIPGAQTPQQPPQQPPIAPNIPGLLPGQRVFIVHMPVPGYRPGTIGGYQPVYIVAAAPQGNTGFPANGYQNAVFLDPSGQVVSPLVGYQRPGVTGVSQSGNTGLVLGAPLTLNRPFDLTYQNPSVAYQLESPTAGMRTVAAVRPVLKRWLDRRHGAPTFRLTQVLTNHGCFGSFLCRIGKEVSAVCHHCGNCRDDTAQHTLEECPAWDEERSALRAVVGGDLSLPAVVLSMVASRRSWRAVAHFCENVMSQKESAERDRERYDPSRHQRSRRRRRVDD